MKNCSFTVELHYTKETIGMAENLYITHIHHIFDDADTFFPAIDHRQMGRNQKEQKCRPTTVIPILIVLPATAGKCFN